MTTHNFNDIDELEFDSDQPTNDDNVYTYTITDADIGTRLDKIATDCFDGFSRVQIQGFIDDGSLLVNGSPQKSKYRVKSGDTLTLTAVLDNHSEDLLKISRLTLFIKMMT